METHCHWHPAAPATALCGRCRRPMCRECFEAAAPPRRDCSECRGAPASGAIALANPAGLAPVTTTCLACQTALPVGSLYCSKCGRASAVDRRSPPTVTARIGRRIADGDLACPNCHRAETIRRVSGLFHAGVTTGSSVGVGRAVGIGTDGLEAIVGEFESVSQSQTGLSRHLSPPAPPPVLDLVFLGWFGKVFYCFAAGALLTMTSGKPDYATLIGMTLVCAALGLACFTVRERVKTRVTPAHVRWDRAYRAWERLYYCDRCDGAFMPGEETIVPTRLVSAWVARVGYGADSGSKRPSTFGG